MHSWPQSSRPILEHHWTYRTSPSGPVRSMTLTTASSLRFGHHTTPPWRRTTVSPELRVSHSARPESTASLLLVSTWLVTPPFPAGAAPASIADRAELQRPRIDEKEKRDSIRSRLRRPRIRIPNSTRNLAAAWSARRKVRRRIGGRQSDSLRKLTTVSRSAKRQPNMVRTNLSRYSPTITGPTNGDTSRSGSPSWRYRVI